MKPYVPKPKSPDRFSGDDNLEFEAWWHQITTYIDFFPTMTGKEKLQLINASITGSALSILLSIPTESRTFEAIYSHLKQVFVAEINWGSKLFDTHQLPSVQSFAKRLRLAVIKANSNIPNINNKFIDEQCLLHFVRNVRPDIRARLQIQLPGTIDLAIRGALAFENKTKGHQIEINSLQNVQPAIHKNDLKTKFKQLHDKIDTLNSKHTELTGTLNTIVASRDINKTDIYKNSTNAFDSDSKNNNYTASIYPYKSVNSNKILCLHCNRQGQGFERCFQATERDKERIRNRHQQRILNGSGKVWNSHRQ